MATNKESDFNRIIIKDEEGNRYTLEFNRRVVERMERGGFTLDTDHPNTMISELFQGAFVMHHKGLSQEKIRDIWMAQRKKDELLTALTKLYMKPLNDLMAEPEGEDESPTWETA